MVQKNNEIRIKKRERLKINNIDEFNIALKNEGYDICNLSSKDLKEKISRTFQLEKSVVDKLHQCIEAENITYRANNVADLIDYMEKIVVFEKHHKKLKKRISEVKKLHINRVEYERELSSQDDVEHIIEAIEDIKNRISNTISEEEKLRLENLEREIEENYLYAKDIELLKKMILGSNGCGVKEKYDEVTQTKTISVAIKEEINYEYISVKEGTVEYHQHISSYIPRMKRLINNIHRYMKIDENQTYQINQSSALQDSINIAIATYNNKEFKAISGKNNITGYCKAPLPEKAILKSCKVNKLGNLGIGYNRVNDSEKKILEEIHKQIEAKVLSDEGELVLYSKWEPCPSCYFVISQFCNKYPKINVEVKYSKKYGEQ